VIAYLRERLARRPSDYDVSIATSLQQCSLDRWRSEVSVYDGSAGEIPLKGCTGIRIDVGRGDRGIPGLPKALSDATST